MDPKPVTFTLANETFTLNTGIADEVRRETHYKDDSMPLTAEEQRILTTLGIDEGMEAGLRPYMSDFFKTLPICTTDASLKLSKACEVPYYVIWSTAFANKEHTKARIIKNKLKYPSRDLLTMAHDGALIDEMRPKSTADDLFKAMFTLIPAKGPVPTGSPKPTGPSKPTGPPKPRIKKPKRKSDPYTRMFTLFPKT